jgi:hypothetical protein
MEPLTATPLLSAPVAGSGLKLSSFWLLALCFLRSGLGADAAGFTFTGNTQAALQALLDRVPERARITCEQKESLVVNQSLRIEKPVTLRGLKAGLPSKLGKTPILIVDAEGVTLTGIEMHGNHDSVNQLDRAPLIQLKRGGFLVEDCRFFDGSKDGLMVAPEEGAGDLVGGVIRRIEGHRMGRDLISLGGGNKGQRVRDITVEDIRLHRGYRRGAVEVSDGSDDIVVRRVYAENAVYAVDVQDHAGSTQEAVAQGRQPACAPNTRIVIEDVEAVNCTHVIRTANRPIGHTDLILRNFTARNCRAPVRISNTTRVRVERLRIFDEPAATTPRIVLQNCDTVRFVDVAIVGLKAGTPVFQGKDNRNVLVEALTLDGILTATQVGQ